MKVKHWFIRLGAWYCVPEGIVAGIDWKRQPHSCLFKYMIVETNKGTWHVNMRKAL